MSDALTDRLATSVRTRAPFVMKYVPYGALSEVHASAACYRPNFLPKPHFLGNAVPIQARHREQVRPWERSRCRGAEASV